MRVPEERQTQPLRRQLPLTELETGQTAIIVSLEGGHGARQRLRSLGILEGRRIRKISRIGKIGPVVLLVDRAQVAIGHGMAKKILVQAHE
ncbi:MAG: FeoA domain-containing protein [Spirochaetales bacterium]|nr:FeoA domain-containing protein [Spirochaetales bacterium]